MESIKEAIGFSESHKELRKKTEKALREVAKLVIETAKQTDTYIVVSDENGNIKKIPAKDL